MASNLYEYSHGVYDRFSRDRAISLERKWNKNRAAFSRDTLLFDTYAGSWRPYQDKRIMVPATEEQFDEAGADDPASALDWRSDTFMTTTKQKVVAGANLVNDQLFKNGDIPFALDLFGTVIGDAANYEILNNKRTNLEQHIKETSRRTDTVKGMKKTVQSASLYGEGYFKMAMETIVYTSHRINKDTGKVETAYEELDFLSGDCISVWDIFRDLSVSDITTGDGIIHRSFVSVADLDDFIEGGEDDFWDTDALEVVRRRNNDTGNMNVGHAMPTPISSSGSDSISPHLRYLDYIDKSLEYLECWIRVPNKLLSEHTCEDFGEYGYTYCMVGLLDDEVVRFNPIDREDIPFLKIDWEIDPDSYPGIGVADNVEGDQKVLNGMIRNYEDNKKLSSNVMFAVNREFLSGDWDTWNPGKTIDLDGARDIREALQQFIVQDVGDNLINGIQMFLQFADMSSNIPRAQQGMPSNNPQTAFEIQQRLERSGKYIGSVISNIDEFLIQPFIETVYDILCLEPDFDDLGGAFRVNPLGFSSYESKAIKQQSLMSVFALTSQNPEFQRVINAQYFLTEISKTLGLNSDEFVKSKEQLQQEQQAAESSPEAQMQHRSQALMLEKLSAEVDKLKAEIALDYVKAGAEKMKASTDAVSNSSGNVNNAVSAFQEATEQEEQ
jgi:hypothetical protein